MQILKESFETTMAQIVDRLNAEKHLELEEDSNKTAWDNSMAMIHQEELNDTVNIEDELANSKATLISTPDFKIKISNQPIEFKKIGKTLRPFLLDIELKGSLKRDFIKKVVNFNHYRKVIIYDKPMLKYNFQYGNMSIDFFTDSINKLTGFFKATLTSKVIKRQRYDYAKTYTREPESKLEGYAFPMIEEQMHERALQLIEELDTLTYQSTAVARMLRSRKEDIILDLQERVSELEAKLESNDT